MLKSACQVAHHKSLLHPASRFTPHFTRPVEQPKMAVFPHKPEFTDRGQPEFTLGVNCRWIQPWQPGGSIKSPYTAVNEPILSMNLFSFRNIFCY